MSTEKTIKTLLIFSVLPLVFALFLAIYFSLNLENIAAISFKFSRLNSYIYAHSYGAILLSTCCGIGLGQVIDSSDAGWTALLYFVLMVAVWLSFKSFADWQGMCFLIFCWLIYATIFFQSSKQIKSPNWLAQSCFRLQISVILLLSLITLINR